MIIFLIVRYELSFDTFHEEGDRIYRVVKGANLGSADSGTSHRLADVLLDELPDIEDAAVAYKLNPNETQVEVNDIPTSVPGYCLYHPLLL